MFREHMLHEPKKGFVYILTNPSFREDWVKIGKSASPIDVLCRELDNTSIPLPFEIYATMETSGFHRAIKIIHAMIDILADKPNRKKRGFFNVDPESVLKIFQSVACSFDDACIRRYENNVPIDEPLVNAIDVQNSKNESPILSKDTEAAFTPKFRFSRVGIKPGDRLVFVPRGIEVTVYDDSRIVYAGKRVQPLGLHEGVYSGIRKECKRVISGNNVLYL